MSGPRNSSSPSRARRGAEPPIACDLTAIDADERPDHQHNAEAVFGAVREILEIRDGYAFRLPPDAELLVMAARFASRERLCCPFYDFSIRAPASGEAIWLELTGGSAVKEFIERNLVSRLHHAPLRQSAG